MTGDLSAVRLVRVRSSNIEAVGFLPAADAGLGTLVVRFSGGVAYAYRDVPAAVHAELMAAQSKGGYMSWRVSRNPAFPHERLAPEVAASLVVSEEERKE